MGLHHLASSVAKNNWTNPRGPLEEGRVDACVELELPREKVKDVGGKHRNVHVYPTSINFSQTGKPRFHKRVSGGFEEFDP
jgi:hypothetical protein